MKRISKHFKTIKQAETYQNRLYNKYNSVKLIQSPFIGESGQYTWEVDNEIKDTKAIKAGSIIQH